MFACCTSRSVDVTSVLLRLLAWKERQRGGLAARRGLGPGGTALPVLPGVAGLSQAQRRVMGGSGVAASPPAKLPPAELRGGRDFAGTLLCCRGAAPGRGDPGFHRPPDAPALPMTDHGRGLLQTGGSAELCCWEGRGEGVMATLGLCARRWGWRTPAVSLRGWHCSAAGRPPARSCPAPAARVPSQPCHRGHAARLNKSLGGERAEPRVDLFPCHPSQAGQAQEPGWAAGRGHGSGHRPCVPGHRHRPFTPAQFKAFLL